MPAPARSWAVYYAGAGTARAVFDNRDGGILDAPQDGVVCVVHRGGGDEINFTSGADFYVFFDDGTVVGTSDYCALLHAVGRQSFVVLFGCYTSNSNHARVMRRAHEEWHGGDR